jgi:predicted nucleotidyltransferase
MTGSAGDSVPYVQGLLDAIGLFEELGIRYALVGGVAAMYYGRARFTEDLDFVAMAGHRDLLDQHGEAMRRHHFDPTCTWKLYHDSGVEIDLWKDEHSDGIAARAAEIELAGRRVRIAEPHDLIAMKLRAGRLQDDYDISEILKNTQIDDSLVKSKVTLEQFAHFLAVKERTA